jgi:hypothetical protein
MSRPRTVPGGREVWKPVGAPYAWEVDVVDTLSPRGDRLLLRRGRPGGADVAEHPVKRASDLGHRTRPGRSEAVSGCR